ncbi:hypothetical protein Pfo_031364 [Paulownia fortunei]|nr:hypothetical protein Pfo_031364 [Paulownia fortunei]
MSSLSAPANVYTTAGNPVTAAAALATLDVIDKERLVLRSRDLGKIAKTFFENAAQRYHFIGDVRMYGLNGGIDIIDNQGQPDTCATNQLIYRIFELGAIMISLRGNILRFQPPLVITKEELTRALAIIDQAFSDLEAGKIVLPHSDSHIGCAPKLDVIEKSPRLGVMSYKGKDRRSLQIAVVPRRSDSVGMGTANESRVVWLDKEKLYVTVYPKDQEAKQIWQEKTDLPDGHIYEVEDNFWDIGEGPSGPDSEIFFDRGPAFQDLPDNDPEMYPGGENERYLEIWNIVFSQFNHLPGLTDNSQYPELPHKNIDTEALTDGFVYDDSQDSESNTSFKVIADHIRAITFAIGDGALPSNEGRGYVIRRLLRRAVLHGQKLGIKGEFLTKLVPVVGEIMVSYYPEISENTTKIQKTIAAEEKRFNVTLAGGLALLNGVIADAKESGLTVDVDGYRDALQAQRERARAARSNDKSMGVQNAVLTDLKVDSKYVGWSKTKVSDAEIVAIIGQDNAGVDALLDGAVANQTTQVVFDVTPFYAEMGGQSGELIGHVIDVQTAPNGQYIHTVEVIADFNLGDRVTLEVDMARHIAVSKNHTATHMLDQALRNVIGGDVHQAGSLVEPDYLRFDFNHDGPVSENDLDDIAAMVNQEIAKKLADYMVETDIESAKKLGAVAEFDGGTHANSTAELGIFKIVSESGIGAGVRRIEAVTGLAALALYQSEEKALKQIANGLKAQKLIDTPNKVSELQAELRNTQRQNESLTAQLANAKAGEILTIGIDGLRQVADNWKEKQPSDILVLASAVEGKVSLIVAASSEAIKQGIKAGDLIKFIAPKIGGGGGGRPDMAQAGGKNPDGITDALAAVADFLADK